MAQDSIFSVARASDVGQKGPEAAPPAGERSASHSPAGISATWLARSIQCLPSRENSTSQALSRGR